MCINSQNECWHESLSFHLTQHEYPSILTHCKSLLSSFQTDVLCSSLKQLLAHEDAFDNFLLFNLTNYAHKLDHQTNHGSVAGLCSTMLTSQTQPQNKAFEDIRFLKWLVHICKRED